MKQSNYYGENIMSENTIKPIDSVASTGSVSSPPKQTTLRVRGNIFRPFSQVLRAAQQTNPTLTVREKIVGPFSRYPRTKKSISKPTKQPPRGIEVESAEVRQAWRKYQATNGRDSVYLYLTAVFDLVRHWRHLNCSLKNSQAALRQQADAPQMKPEPFGIVIFCTADPEIADAKTRSKWSRVLRFAQKAKSGNQTLTEFIKSNGGVNACAHMFARQR
jgi:hypothetical protein